MTARDAFRTLAKAGVERVAAFNRARLARRETPFATGIHAPMPPIELTLERLAVDGSVPATLRGGAYLKMGANPVDPALRGQHWFLGDGMVHAFGFGADGSVSWRNRFIRSRSASARLEVAPAPGPRRGRNDTVNTNVVPVGDQPLAVVEAGSFPVRLDRHGENQRYDDFGGTLAGGFSGHPHRDPRTGDWHAITYDGDIADTIHHVVVSDSGDVARRTAIAVRDGPCVHDMALTRRFVVVLDLPVTFSIGAVLGGRAFPYRWNRRHPARVGLLPRDGSGRDIVWCDVAPCFVFHVANAFDDEDGTVVVDVVAYDTMFASSAGGVDAVGRLERWTVDPVARRVDRRVLDGSPQEFPRIDERRFGTRHRFVYTVAGPPDGDTQLGGASSLLRYDAATGERRAHDFGSGRVAGEFVFVPDGDGDEEEDAGWLVGLVIDRAEDRTELVILDARALEAPPVAVARIPHRIPPGFHGNWFPPKKSSDLERAPNAEA